MAVVLGITVVSAAGIRFSSGSGRDKSVVTAIRYSDSVRFAVPNDQVAILRATVFDLGGKRLFDPRLVMENALDWAMTTGAGERAAHGVYVYVITAWDAQGELVKSQVGEPSLLLNYAYSKI
ncbi:MAG: hypothetical protein NUW06_07950 [Candidatus Acetothermia bacterium]|nr:hypothetical protein [Candidatus Acetothermia bacterium]MDH7505986.1 hypothetical protein [Candidatus Acetothermia bacterium]